MPITIGQIKTLQQLSAANFRKHECQHCKNEFYSIREAKFCCNACKQSSYRARQLNEEPIPEKKTIEIPEKKTKIIHHSDMMEKLKQKEKIYTQKLKAI